MYEFTIVVLLGLASLKVVDLLAELVPAISRFRTLATMITAVVGVALLDYSLFSGFGVEVRDAWFGSLVTGIVAGSTASVWAALLSRLGGASTASSSAPARTERPRVAA